MKVLLITTHLNVGGITTYLLNLSRGLIEKGHEVWVVSSGGKMEGKFKRLGAHVNVYDIRTKSELSLKPYRALPEIRRLILEKDIDILHGHTRISQVMAAFLSKLTGRPFVTTCHGFYKRRFSRRLFPCWGRKAIAISPPVGEYLRKDFNIPEQDICQVFNGIAVQDYEIFNEDRHREVKKKFRLSGRKVIGVIARLADVKGHQYLIEAMPRIISEVPDAFLIIIGEGKMEGFLKARVRELGLEEYVRFEPVVGRPRDYFQLLDAFVLPSLDEGFGLSVLEAQATALPVVVSNIGGLPFMVKDGQTGFLCPVRDSAALAEKVLICLKDPRASRDMGLRARAFVETIFSADRMVEKTIQCYRSVLNDEENSCR